MPNAKVNEYAGKICGWNGNDCGSIDHWLRRHYHYRSEREEIVRTPEFMLNDFETIGFCEGDCDDVATLACGIAHHSGIPSRLTAIASIVDNPHREFDHVFAELNNNGYWVPCDPTVTYGTVYQCTSVYHEFV